MRRSAVLVGLLMLGAVSVPVLSSPASAAFSLTASGPWTSNDGLLSGTWQAHFDVAGYDLGGTLDVLGLPGIGSGNISGSWDLNNIGFGVMFTGQELASFTGGLQGGQLVGQFQTADVIGQWSGLLSDLSFSSDPIVPIIEATIPTLVLSQVSGNLGSLVNLGASLYTLGTSIKSIENVLNFDSNTPILALANGTPNCSVNPFIDKADTIFQFLPQGCSGSACTQVKAIVQSLTNSLALPDGATVFSCKVRIAQQAAAGIYQLVSTALSALGIDNLPVQIASWAGQISAQLPFLKQIKHGCHCSTVESSGPLPLPSLLAPLLLLVLRRRQRSSSSIRN